MLQHEVGHAPTLERPIFRGGEQVPPISREPDGDDRALVCKTGKERRIDRRGIDRHELPEVDPFVAAPADHVLPVGREHYGEHLPLRLIERVETHAVAGPPELDRLVGARRTEQRSTRVPGEVEDRPVVDVNRTKQRPIGHIPELDRTVVARSGKKFPVGREFGVIEHVAVAAERADQAAGGQIPKFGHTGEAGHATSDDERFAIRTEVHRIRLPRKVDGCHLAGWHGCSAGRSGHDHEPTAADNGNTAAVGRDRRGGHRHRSHVRWQLGHDQRLQ